MITPPNIGQILKEYVDRNRLFQSGWARQAGITAKTVATYLKNPDMRISTLFTISQTLNHNFLREVADMLPPSMPPAHVPDPTAEIAELKQQVSNLKLQVETYREALALAGSGRGG